MIQLPTGTITFLFTDIEGSTTLWEHQPEAMKTALARHDELLKGAIEARGGYVFKTVGDAFCAAFAEPTDALEAILAAQRALQAEPWPAEIGGIRIRAALHTGVAEERDGDYFGQPLNRVARLLATGHGGQTLLTLATQELVRDQLPSRVTLADLGEHRLKDLFRPEHIYQLNASDLPTEFPPLKTLDLKLTNLPAQPTPFIGREREITALLGLMRNPAVRLVTLTGAGGTGKTRLSLQVGADLLDDYEHGVYFIALDAILNPDGVIPQIISVLNVKPSAESNSPLNDLKNHLADKQILLILDNFEQVVEAGPAVGELINAAPRLKVLVSSRAVLNLYGEHDYPIPPLGLPDRHRKQTVAVLSQYESVALFIQRARASKADFDISEENAPAIAEICFKLDGLPLAIELAAARVKIFSPQVMLERLSERLKTLTGGARNLPARQRTLRGAIDWSYDLLDGDEKTVFARLSVFSGGWTLDAAEAICGDSLGTDVPSVLESLIAKSLIRETDSLSGLTRFTMLETIREYAAEKLLGSSEADAIGERHADYVTQQIESVPALTSDVWNRLIEESDNTRRAAEWSLAHGKPQNVLRMGTILYDYWPSGDWREKVGWLEQALEKRELFSPELLSDGLRAVGALLLYHHQVEQSRRFAAEALQVAREHNYREGIGRLLNNLAIIAKQVDHDYPKARSLWEEAQKINLEIGNTLGAAIVSGNLCTLLLAMGEIEAARPYAAEALRLATAANSQFHQMWAYTLLIFIAFTVKDYAAARESLLICNAMAREVSHPQPARYAMLLWGMLYAFEGKAERAARLLGFNEAVTEIHGLQPLDSDDQAYYDRALEQIHAALDPTAFDAAWERGRAMSIDEAFDFVAQ